MKAGLQKTKMATKTKGVRIWRIFHLLLKNPQKRKTDISKSDRPIKTKLNKDFKKKVEDTFSLQSLTRCISNYINFLHLQPHDNLWPIDEFQLADGH